MRKIIQIINASSENGTKDNVLHALCDDGSTWRWKRARFAWDESIDQYKMSAGPGWVLVQEIPQEEL